MTPGEMNWFLAMDYAAYLSLAGKTDWRLPILVGLETLLDSQEITSRFHNALID